jgi:hypothetical protein
VLTHYAADLTPSPTTKGLKFSLGKRKTTSREDSTETLSSSQGSTFGFSDGSPVPPKRAKDAGGNVAGGSRTVQGGLTIRH